MLLGVNVTWNFRFGASAVCLLGLFLEKKISFFSEISLSLSDYATVTN